MYALTFDPAQRGPMPEPQDHLLRAVFRWSDARSAGVSDARLRDWLVAALIERVGHGLYRRTDAEVVDLDLVLVAATDPRATLCLTTALADHDLTDRIPDLLDVALPRGTRRPVLAAPVRWHTFARTTFDVGRETLTLSTGHTIGRSSPERSVVDAYRMRHLVGDELGREALRAWLRRPDARPSDLLSLAAEFPRAHGRLREDLRVLL